MTAPLGRPDGSGRRRTWTFRLTALALAGICVVTFYAVYLVTDRTLVGQHADELTFRVVFGLVPGGWPVEGLSWFARSFVIVGLAVVVLVLFVVAGLRRAWSALVRAPVIVVASVGLTLWLRNDVLVRDPLQPETFPVNSMPSTHASAAAALVAAAVLLWPSVRPWWLARVAGVVVLLVVVGNVVSQAHRPSDVVASLLLVAGIALVVLAVTPDQPSAPR